LRASAIVQSAYGQDALHASAIVQSAYGQNALHASAIMQSAYGFWITGLAGARPSFLEKNSLVYYAIIVYSYKACYNYLVVFNTQSEVISNAEGRFQRREIY